MLTVKTNYAIDPTSAKAMDTDDLRRNFLSDGMFASKEIRLIYSHYDRMIVGGAVPENETLVLDRVKECGTASMLDRREMGILNIGKPGTVSAGGQDYAVGKGDMLYLPMGSGAISFSGAGRFYIVSTPAHTSYPARLLTLADAVSLKMGAPETANDRAIFQFIHPDVMPTCQLVMGYTKFHGGSVWNTTRGLIRIRNLALLLAFASLPIIVSAAINEQEVLEAKPQHAKVSRIVTTLFEHSHYRRAKVSNDLSSKMLDRYLKALDGNRFYFLASDVDNFEKYRFALDDSVRSGRVQPVFSIFEAYRDRVIERMKYSLEALNGDFDFTRDESYVFDREDAEWPATDAEAREIWRKKTKNTHRLPETTILA